MRRSVLPLLAILPAAAAAGCATAGIELPADLASADRMEVDGRGGWGTPELVTFGPFELVEIDRSWTRGSGLRVGLGGLGGTTARARQTYEFTVRSAGTVIGVVECDAGGDRATVNLPVVDVDASAAATLVCALGRDPARVRSDDDHAGWELALDASRDRHMVGHVGAGDRRYTVTGTGPGGRFTPAHTYGFEIRAGERVVAAVETVNQGAVWLAPDLEPGEREALALAAGALLLYEETPTEE